MMRGISVERITDPYRYFWNRKSLDWTVIAFLWADGFHRRATGPCRSGGQGRVSLPRTCTSRNSYLTPAVVALCNNVDDGMIRSMVLILLFP
jgi:hypothetical protein